MSRQHLMIAVVVTGAILAPVTASAGGPPTCNGLPATQVGTPGPDLLVGGPGVDVIVGGDGDDVIKGKDGDDVLCGNGGDDVILGGGGNDIILGGGGRDTIDGKSGRDTIRGGSRADTIEGGRGRDVLLGGSGKDEIYGDAGRDKIKGQKGRDHADGGSGQDTCFTAETMESCLVGLTLTLVAELPPGHEAGIAVSPPGDPRLFVVDQTGPIWEVGPGGRETTPLIDLTGRVSTAYEQGVLGLAFHPDYASNGRFFVFSTQTDWDIVIEEFVDDDDWPIDPTSGSTVIEIDHPAATNHNGGMLAFGDDGYLYASVGDGGTGGHEARDTSSLLGGIIRLDVDSAAPYAIPPGNPFAAGPGADELWAYGLRNPWRFAFDDGLIYIGDVGQGLWEEISVEADGDAGLDYGWDILEGTHCHNPSSGCSSAGTELPAHEESHANGSCSIIGGFVYRGAAMPEIAGHYAFGDFCAGFLKTFRYANGKRRNLTTWISDTGHSITSFGVDADGELYVATHGGDLYRIDPVR